MTEKAPPPPNFEAMDSMAPATVDQRTYILAMIGNLNFSWSNNESMFIYLVMLLLETDLQSAVITFTTLNTTRARLDLVRRLAKAKIKDPKLLKKIEQVISKFNDCTKLRNELNHCIYHISPDGRFTHITVLRISEGKSGLKVGYDVRLDKRKLDQMAITSAKLKRINREIWQLMPLIETDIAASATKEDPTPA